MIADGRGQPRFLLPPTLAIYVSVSKIAFLRADAAVTDNDQVWYNRPDKVNSNIVISDTSGATPQKVTNFTGVKNSFLRWTPGGNILLSSTSGNTSNTFNIVAVSTINGAATELVGSSPGEALTYPVIAASGAIPGMPRAGKATPEPAP